MIAWGEQTAAGATSLDVATFVTTLRGKNVPAARQPQGEPVEPFDSAMTAPVHGERVLSTLNEDGTRHWIRPTARARAVPRAGGGSSASR